MQRFLLTNGLGGYASLTRDFTALRQDDGVFVAALQAPENKVNMVRRLEETLVPENPLSLQHFSLDPVPCWIYKAGSVILQRQIVLGYGENTCALLYRVENTGFDPCAFTVRPVCSFSSRENTISVVPGKITDGLYTLYIKSDGEEHTHPARWQDDGFTCAAYTLTVQPGQTGYLNLVFGCQPTLPAAEALLQARHTRKKQLLAACPFREPVARHLYMAADDFIVKRACDGAKILLTGYPHSTQEHPLCAFAGCLLATGRYNDAKEILNTYRNDDPLYKECLEKYYARQIRPQCADPISPEALEDRLTENCLGQLSFGDCYAHALSVATALLPFVE